MHQTPRERRTRVLGEQHVKEDCGGRIPCLSDWLCRIAPAPRMSVGPLTDDETVTDLSLDAWCQAVATRQTQLGYGEWQDAMRPGPAREIGHGGAAHRAAAV